MGKIIAVANQKGGVGKTTTAVNMASSLGFLEKKVLLIDADPQANATSGLGIDLEAVTKSTYQVIEHRCSAKEAIANTSFPNLDIMPSHLDLVAAELEIVDNQDREYMLKTALKEVVDDYDYLIIDCAPSLGLVTLNALTAADSILIPIQCEYFALEGLGKLLNTIRTVQDYQNNQLTIEGLLLTMHDGRLRLSNQVVDEVRQHFQDLVFKTMIARNVRLSEAPSFGQPIMVHDAGSTGAENYLNLAQEILARNPQLPH